MRGELGTVPETETGLQDALRHLALVQGWQYFHPYDSRRSAPGFPDIVLVRDTALIFAELKSARGVVMPEQQRWLDALRQVQTVETHLWRPADWAIIEQRLRKWRRNPLCR